MLRRNPKEVLRPAEEQQSRRMKTRICQSEDISQAEQGESVLAFHVTVLGDSIAKGYSGDKAVDIESYGSIAADKLSGELGMPYSFQNFAKNGLDSAGMNEKILPPGGCAGEHCLRRRHFYHAWDLMTCSMSASA